MESPDAIIVVEGSEAYSNVEEIREAAEAISFAGDITVTGVQVEGHKAEEVATPDGPKTTTPVVFVFFHISIENEADYAEEGNASGLEIDLHWKVTGGVSDDLREAVSWEVTVVRSRFCDHPEELRVKSNVSEDGCVKCDGPVSR